MARLGVPFSVQLTMLNHQCRPSPRSWSSGIWYPSVGELFAAARGPCVCFQGSQRRWWSTGSAGTNGEPFVCPPGAQRGSVTLLFHDHYGFLVKELKQKSSDCRHHSNALSFLAPSSATAIESSLLPFHHTLPSILGSGTPPAAFLFSVTVSTASYLWPGP